MSDTQPEKRKPDASSLPRLPDGRVDWDAMWHDQITPWDMGKPSPPLVAWLKAGALPKGRRVLLPGCGRAYEARLLAEAGYEPVGVDLCGLAVEEARTQLADIAGATIIQADVIADIARIAETPFDWAFDQTFFCALEPRDRAPSARAMARALRPGGELWALTFQVGTPDGPPYHTDAREYADIHIAAGFEEIEIRKLDIESHTPRQGRETLVRLRRGDSMRA